MGVSSGVVSGVHVAGVGAASRNLAVSGRFTDDADEHPDPMPAQQLEIPEKQDIPRA
jgi:hypothetical protein